MLVLDSLLIILWLFRQDTGNKEACISYNDLDLLMLHSFACREAVVTTNYTIFCIVNRSITGCELVCTSHE